MLLIHCPYCGARPEIEFTYGGQAHLARPARPGGTQSDDEWAAYLYLRDNPRGLHAERWRHVRGCGRFFNALRDTTTDRFAGTYKRRGARAVSAFRDRRQRRAHRPGAHARVSRFDGAAYEGLAGDTLASALLANGVHLVGRSFKYHRPRGIVTAGAEEPNALVTVRRDAARETPNLRATQVELYDGLEARFAEPLAEPALRRRARERLPVAALAGGLLLQDLHVAARGLGGALRAADPPRGGPRAARRRSRIPTATRSASRIATCSSSAPGPRASPRRSRPPRAARA